MYWVLGILAIIISFILVIGVHEAGHALAAKYFGVLIQSIAIGFGKPLLIWHDRSKRQWIWGWLPLGGYVNLSNTRQGYVAPKKRNFSFDRQPVWKRIIILLSGSVANILIAFLALVIFYLSGYPQIRPVIASVQKESIADQAQLTSGDRFLYIDQRATPSWQEASKYLLLNLGKEHVPVQIKNPSGQIRLVELDLSHWARHAKHDYFLTIIGIVPDSSIAHQHQVPGTSFSLAIHKAWKTCLKLACYFLELLKLLITGHIPFFLLLGPIGLFMTMITSFLQGFVVFLYFIAQLNIVVGLMNLLPLPSLDGGSIVYAIIEKIRKKPISIASEVLFHRLVVIALAVLLIKLILNDFQRLFDWI